MSIRFTTAYILLLLCITSCRVSPGGDQSGHDRMIAVLDSINTNAQQNPLEYFYANEYRLTYLDSLVAANPGDARLQYNYALELQNSMKLEQSVPILEQLKSRMITASSRQMIYDALSVSYLRLAEVNNCIENYTPVNCILPFDKEAIHANKAFVQSSIENLELLLDNFRGNYAHLWMYNIAHIANGSYPAEVRKEFLIPELQNGEDLPDGLQPPLFTDKGRNGGIGDNRISGSVCVEDFNGDGHLDIFTTSYGFGDRVMLYLSDGTGEYTDETEAANLGDMPGGLNIECADINNSGYTDVLVLRGAWLGENGKHPNSLLRNNGDGTFTDITIDSGLFEAFPTQVAAFADLNHDGYLDLFIGNESSSSWQNVFSGGGSASGTYPSAIFMNNGDDSFTSHQSLPGFELNDFVKGAAWGDINNDHLPDLYVSVMGGENKLFVHRGIDENNLPRFEEIGTQAGVSSPQFSFPTWFFDYDNDGLDDIFVATYDVRAISNVAHEVAREKLGLSTQTEYSRLYKNIGNESFRDVSKEAGLQTVMFGMGANFADLNNNGYPDIYIGTGAPDLKAIIPNRLFLNDQGKSFHESTARSGVGHLQKGHGVSMADFDGNGLIDIYMVLGGAVEGDYYHNALFKNQTTPTDWLIIELEGVSANDQGIGAKVVAVLQKDGEEVHHRLHRTVSTGGSFGSNNSRVHFGLGGSPNTTVREIRITWPGQESVQVVKNPETNQLLKIRQHSD